jgi:hypothetical protein
MTKFVKLRAREFSRSQISNPPLANEIARPSDAFKRFQADGFKDWRRGLGSSAPEGGCAWYAGI